MSTNALAAIPVYNEENCLGNVLERTLECAVDVLVVDDGSTDRTSDVLRQFDRIHVIRHETNRGYGAALRAAFEFGIDRGYHAVVTLDSDGQHEPSFIPKLLSLAQEFDIVSGSRYRQDFHVDTPAPAERQRVNRLVTDELNACFELDLTDSFCGFKAYRTDALLQLELTEDGYGMPLELWVQAAYLKLSVHEVPVPRLYLDPERSFGHVLDDAAVRLAYYQQVIDRSIARVRRRAGASYWQTPAPVLQKADQ